MKLQQLPQDTERVILYVPAVVALLASVGFFFTVYGIIFAPFFAVLGVSLLYVVARVGHTPTAK